MSPRPETKSGFQQVQVCGLEVDMEYVWAHTHDAQLKVF